MKKHLIFFCFWQHMFPNLDLALLMATVTVFSSLPRSWCIRILQGNYIVKIELNIYGSNIRILRVNDIVKMKL